MPKKNNAIYVHYKEVSQLKEFHENMTRFIDKMYGEIGRSWTHEFIPTLAYQTAMHEFMADLESIEVEIDTYKCDLKER